MLRQVKSVWLIVNIALLYVPFVALLAGILTVFGVKKYVLCQEGCTVCSFTQARTDGQLSLAGLELRGVAGGWHPPGRQQMTKSIPSVKSPSPLDYQFCVLHKTYHAHEVLKFSTYGHLRTK